MQFIGKINTKMFELISNDIITDEVILTDKQRMHINERHPEILIKYEGFFKTIIENPDFIIKDNTRENTALLFKTINNNSENKKISENVNVVLKLAVENNSIYNKNSIITCIPIGKNRLRSYINNGKIIYKNE
ncbi:MAG: hypothetical protein J6N78_04230 [Clostridia bacterium]|nr:hypothetical protein [Clostridia bacterium]